ncbi:hypothetical protein ES705_29465 [subsurface metagenome]
MNNENCYGCIYLRQFSKKEQEESMEVWRKAKKSGALRCLADTNPHIAECMCEESDFKGYMTGTYICRFDNCPHYKLGEKSKEQVYEEFKETGFYGELEKEHKDGTKLIVSHSPEYSTKSLTIPVGVLEKEGITMGTEESFKLIKEGREK